jgi:hypothetical protein
MRRDTIARQQPINTETIVVAQPVNNDYNSVFLCSLSQGYIMRTNRTCQRLAVEICELVVR